MTRREKPGGAESWWEVFGPRSAPRRGERGHVETLAERIPPGVDLEDLIDAAMRLWASPDIGPFIGGLLDEMETTGALSDPDEEDAWGFSARDLGALLGWDDLPYEAALDLFAAVQRALVDIPGAELALEPEWVKIAIVGDELRARDPERARRPRLVAVSKELAMAFVEEHHSKLPRANYRGLLYAVGVVEAGRLVAVALANTPSGQFRSRGCPKDGILELSRVASDGSVRGASSMLASRMLDLLPTTERFGVKGCLFVTYSLLSEAGHSYLALADKGLRPTALIPGKLARTGARKGAGHEALPQEPKILWEAGPEAAPPAWEVLSKTAASPAAVEGAKRALGAFLEREARDRARQTRALTREAAPGTLPPAGPPARRLSLRHRFRRAPHLVRPRPRP